MKVKNINGTSDTNCSCGSWIKHWEKFSGQHSDHCQSVSCSNRNPVGAHVQKATGPDNKWYIYPLCDKCNQLKGELEVSDTYRLVSANKQETCEKQ